MSISPYISAVAQPVDESVKWLLEDALKNEGITTLGGYALPLEPEHAARVLAAALRSLGGPGSGNHGHQGGAGGAGNPGGSSRSGRSLSNERIQRMLLENAVMQTQGGFSDRTIVNMEGMSVADRTAIIDQYFTNKPGLFYSNKRHEVDSKAYDQLKKDAKEGNWTATEILDEGLKRNLFSFEQTGKFTYKAGSSYPFSADQVLNGLDEAGRAEMEDALIPTIKSPGASWNPDLESFVDAGWTKPELERLADKLQAAGASRMRWGKDERSYSGADSLAGELAFFSNDYENFRTEIFNDWAMMGGTETARRLRHVSEEAFPLEEGGEYFRLPKKDASFRSGLPERFYSPRAVENVRRLKAETEAFYGPKMLEKTIKVVRGVGGHPTAYTPGAIESWSTDGHTARRFAKLMSHGKNEDSSILTAEVKLRDVLWTYKSAAGKPGWPADKDLKGKKEHVVLGRALKNIGVSRND